MSTAVSNVNIVLAGFVFAGVVGFLAWSIARGHPTGVARLHTRQARSDKPTAYEHVAEHAAEPATHA
jgi:hypothetical protein